MTMQDRLMARVTLAGHGVVAMGTGESFENEKWRVHRYMDSVEVVSLEGAGKKGAKCLRMVLVNNGKLPMEGLAAEMMMHAKRGDSITRMQQAMKEGEQLGGKLHEGWLRGVDVKPGNFRPLMVRGIHVTIKADYDSFDIIDIADEDVNGTQCMAKGKRSVGQLYRWVQDNGRAAQTMTFSEITQALKAAGIDFHQFCSID